jgi:ketosteroid isomerase-like protein
MPENIVELAIKYGEAWAAHDAEAIAALHTDDSVFHLHDVSPAAEGRGAVRRMIAAQLLLIPDLKFERVRVHFGADHFVTEYVMSGTAEGHAFAIQGADVFSVRDLLVARKDSYLDWAAFIRQTGLDPAQPPQIKAV